MAWPMSLKGRPGRTAAMPRSRHSRVTSMRRLDASSMAPTANVALVSPWTPSRKIVTSRLTMSPSRSGRSSGMPWQMTSFTEVHNDFGIAAVVEGARVAAVVDVGLMDHGIDGVGGHPRRHGAAAQLEDLGGCGPGSTHALDHVGRLDPGFVPAHRHARLGVVRPGDVVGNRPRRAERPRSEDLGDVAVAALELAATAAPARIVRLQHEASVRVASLTDSARGTGRTVALTGVAVGRRAPSAP